MSGVRIIVGLVAAVGAMAAGIATWMAIAPGEEQRKERLKNLPESNAVRMEQTRKMNALVMQALKDAAETNENIARGGFPGPGK